MQTYTDWRRTFIAQLRKEGVAETRARIILAATNVIQQIAADNCSNEANYNAMEETRRRCPVCFEGDPYEHEREYDRHADGRLVRPRPCAEHRAERRIRTAIAGTSIRSVEFSWDPRGCCVKLRLASGYGDCFGDPSLFCVPVREI